jgi:hypothetical protein
VIATIVALGGAVAGVYTTGVTLGARLAPSDEGDGSPLAGPEGELGSRAPDGSSSSDQGPGSSSLPDRAAAGGTTSTGSDPSTPGGGTAVAGGSGSATPDPVEPYPGVWPYSSWDEVAAHASREDARYRTPGDTALRFATEVVGLTGASVGVVDERGVVATVEIRSGRGATLVELTGATAGETTPATPWSVVSATGTAGLEVPTSVAGGSVRVRTDASPGVVGVHDRSRWRGIGVAPSPGSTFDLRIDPGPGGPGIAVALAGDPRSPASFTVRRIQIAAGSGTPVPAAPADPIASTRALVDALGRGDVGATWELLDPAARRSVLDWRGLAGRLPALRDQLSAFGSGELTTTDVTTPIGPVAVVAPAVTTDGTEAISLSALAFRSDGGAARLASTEGAAIDWTGPTVADPTVLASGAARPLALVVDGAVWAATAEGTGGLRASAATLAPGVHIAIAISVQGEQVTASAFPFVVTAPVTPSGPAADDAPADEPPEGTPRDVPAVLPEDGE